jgi:hypothetical protein
MATETRKVLAQYEIPAAGVPTLAYTVPALTQTVCSTFTVCNINGAARKFRLVVSVGGAALANKQYAYYDENVPATSTFAGTLGITLGAGDKIYMYGSAAGLQFNLFGVEIA